MRYICVMRDIGITQDCLEFIEGQEQRVSDKFFYLIEVISEIKIIDQNFIKKIQSTQFYELRIKAGNEYRVVIFAIDHLNFAECTKAICLCGFLKKSNKDYKKAIRKAERLLEEHLKS